MQKILRASAVYRFFAVIYAWFGRQWRKSWIIRRFLTSSKADRSVSSSVFTKFWDRFHRALCTCFEKVRLTRLLEGSIFCMPFIWTGLSLALAPLLPTIAVFVLAVVSFLSLLLYFGCNRGARLSYAPVNRFILLYAFIYLISIFTSVTISGSLPGGLMMVFFVLFALVMQNSITTRRQLDTIIYGFVLCGTLVSLYGIYQYVFGVTGAASWLDSDMFSSIATRVYSTLDNPNVLSEYLLLAIPFAFACALTARRARSKLLFTACLCVMIACILLTFARGGWLGLIVAAAIFLIMLDRRFIVVLIVGVVVLYFVLPSVVITRFTSIGNLGDTSTSYRLSIWMGTLAMLKDYWFTGVGPGTAAFNKIYPLYSYNSAAAQHSHNLFLQITCDSGICGILVFLFILFTFFRMLASAVSHETDRSSKIFQIAAISAVAGFLVQSATDYSFYNYRVTLVFWAILGLGAVLTKRSSLVTNHTNIAREAGNG